MEDLILLSEAPEVTGLTYRVLYLAVKKEKIRSLRSGHQIYLYRDSLAEFKQAWDRINGPVSKQEPELNAD
jgi:hypothetical protein